MSEEKEGQAPPTDVIAEQPVMGVPMEALPKEPGSEDQTPPVQETPAEQPTISPLVQEAMQAMPIVIQAVGVVIAEEMEKRQKATEVVAEEEAQNCELDKPLAIHPVETPPVSEPEVPTAPVEQPVVVPVEATAPTPKPTEAETAVAKVEETVTTQTLRHLTTQDSRRNTFLSIIALVLLLTVVGMLLYQSFKQPNLAPPTNSEPVSVSVTERKIRTPMVQPDIYKKISEKFAQTVKKQVMNEREITEKIGDVVFKSANVERLFRELFAETEKQLLEEGVTNINGVASTFLNKKIVDAVMEELPPEIKALPNAEGYVRIELGKYASNLSNDLLQSLP